MDAWNTDPCNTDPCNTDHLFSEISTVLWRERNLLEQLQFKLHELQLLLDAGRSRWLLSATREVDLVLGSLKAAELLRAVRVEEVLAGLGLRPSATLEELADALVDPWRSILFDHHQALVLLTGSVTDAAARAGHAVVIDQVMTEDLLVRSGDHPRPGDHPSVTS